MCTHSLDCLFHERIEQFIEDWLLNVLGAE